MFSLYGFDDDKSCTIIFDIDDDFLKIFTTLLYTSFNLKYSCSNLNTFLINVIDHNVSSSHILNGASSPSVS